MRDCQRNYSNSPLSCVRAKHGLYLMRAVLLVVIAVGAASAIAVDAAAVGTLAGAGSTLVAPLEQQWGLRFAAANPGESVTYNGVGSGAGVQYVAKGLVDFGATDAPLDSVSGVTCTGCVLVPWALTATGIGYNIGSVREGLKLTGKILAKIYLGQIRNWDDPQITRINKGAPPSESEDHAAFRSDTSGDSYAFTGYLSAVSPAWTAKNGRATVSFPPSHGIAENGNGGVASEIKAVNGAIGYVSVSYLVTQKITVARVENTTGNCEFPNLSNIENAAAEIKTVPAGNAMRIVDPPKRYTKRRP